uniref:Uncharacterized protein n=1 Tax=Rhizophora mucronata TaxID=61149 RepID=A0A2P2PM38_RHIMU
MSQRYPNSILLILEAVL